ncbi:hypothetical protein D3C84_1263680 [compost metagenome]
MYVTLAPVVQVSPSQGGISNEDARKTGEMVKAITMGVLQEAVRPNGMLDNWRRNG